MHMSGKVENLPTFSPDSLDSEAWSRPWSSPLRLRWTFSETWSFPAQHEGLFKRKEEEKHTDRIKETGITLNIVNHIIGLSWILQPLVTVKEQHIIKTVQPIKTYLTYLPVIAHVASSTCCCVAISEMLYTTTSHSSRCWRSSSRVGDYRRTLYI